MNDTTATDREMTHADRAHLLRMIARAATDDGLPAPMGLDLFSSGYAIVRLDNDDTAAVEVWAETLGATLVHGRTFDADGGKPWHEFGTRPQGGVKAQWRGWRIDLWCVVKGPGEPTEPEAGA